MTARTSGLTPKPDAVAGTGDPVPAPGWQPAVLRWGDDERRDLPWRATRDPWAILVSEAMLQQTQVTRVVPRYHAFLARFPTPTACAAAPAGEVVVAWAGLGYNRRAVQLHRAASTIAAEHGGVVPDSLAELQALPGIGPYTARAVLAFAHERDVGVVDTNAARVLARTAGRPLRPREAQAIADAAVPPGRGWAWNQAMLDLGATICRARAPRCDACPARPSCAWSQAGCPEPDPAVGSAGVPGRQSRFDGSDRQGRGRLVDVLRAGPIPPTQLPTAMGWPDDPDRAARVVLGMLADGLVVRTSAGSYALP
jgi:A/G-specific adenine glycosylase